MSESMTETDAAGAIGAQVDENAAANGRKAARPTARTGLGGADLGIDGLGDVMEFARMMAASNFMVPEHLRGNVGDCAGVIMQALRWGMEPYAVACQTYVTKVQNKETGKVIERMAYMSQFIAGVVNAQAPIRDGIDYRLEGAGAKRKCVAFVITRSGKMLEAETPEIGSIPDFNKRSPLWKSNPDQQLCYLAAKLLARRHFPGILLRVISDDGDFEDASDATATSDSATGAAPRIDGAPPPGASANDDARPRRSDAPTAEPVGAKPGNVDPDRTPAARTGLIVAPKVSEATDDVRLRIRRLCGQARKTGDFGACRRAAEESFDADALALARSCLELEETRSQIDPERFRALTQKLAKADSREAFAALRARTEALLGEGIITSTERDIYLQDIVFAEMDFRRECDARAAPPGVDAAAA